MLKHIQCSFITGDGLDVFITKVVYFLQTTEFVWKFFLYPQTSNSKDTCNSGMCTCKNTKHFFLMTVTHFAQTMK